jgi:hypothetical protein
MSKRRADQQVLFMAKRRHETSVELADNDVPQQVKSVVFNCHITQHKAKISIFCPNKSKDESILYSVCRTCLPLYSDLVEQHATDYDIFAAKNSMVELPTDADTVNQSITLKHTTVKLPYLNFTETVTKILTIIHDPYSIEHHQFREDSTQLLSDKNVFQWANVLNVMRVKVSHDMSNCIQKSAVHRMNKYMATIEAFFTTYTLPSTDLFSSIWNTKEVMLYQGACESAAYYDGYISKPNPASVGPRDVCRNSRLGWN